MSDVKDPIVLYIGAQKEIMPLNISQKNNNSNIIHKQVSHPPRNWDIVVSNGFIPFTIDLMFFVLVFFSAAILYYFRCFAFCGVVFVFWSGEWIYEQQIYVRCLFLFALRA